MTKTKNNRILSKKEKKEIAHGLSLAEHLYRTFLLHDDWDSDMSIKHRRIILKNYEALLRAIKLISELK